MHSCMLLWTSYACLVRSLPLAVFSAASRLACRCFGPMLAAYGAATKCFCLLLLQVVLMDPDEVDPETCDASVIGGQSYDGSAHKGPHHEGSVKRKG